MIHALFNQKNVLILTQFNLKLAAITFSLML